MITLHRAGVSEENATGGPGKSKKQIPPVSSNGSARERIPKKVREECAAAVENLLLEIFVLN